MQRVIPFEGTHNFRDMGGYRTADGRHVKRDLFYRSDELTGLTEQDTAAFRELNIKTIIDYRDDYEALKKPDPALAGTQNIRIPAIPAGQAAKINMPGNANANVTESANAEANANAGASAGASANAGENDAGGGHFIVDLVKSGFFKQFRADTMMLDLYAKLPFGNPSYKRLMDMIQDSGNLGLLHHCTAGKDRTGVGAALILLALGVPEHTVMEDYLLTNETMKAFNGSMLSRLAEHVNEEELHNIEHMLGVREAFMEAVFSSIKDRYGRYEAYFAEEFGLTPLKREALQAMCLE